MKFLSCLAEWWWTIFVFYIITLLATMFTLIASYYYTYGIYVLTNPVWLLNETPKYVVLVTFMFFLTVFTAVAISNLKRRTKTL